MYSREYIHQSVHLLFFHEDEKLWSEPSRNGYSWNLIVRSAELFNDVFQYF